MNFPDITYKSMKLHSGSVGETSWSLRQAFHCQGQIFADVFYSVAIYPAPMVLEHLVTLICKSL